MFLGRLLTKAGAILAHPGSHALALHRQNCNICRRPSVFLRDSVEDPWIRRCLWCRSTPKYRAIQFTAEQHLKGTLDELLNNGGRIYEASTTSPIHRRYRGGSNYVSSGFFFDQPFGVEVRPGVWNEDVQQLSFVDASFDVVISSETMEHVRRPWLGFREIQRVLKPGGIHVFTIPYRDDRLTTARVDTSGEENVYLLPKVYHQDPYRTEDSLVFTDFGRDLPELLSATGFATGLERVLDPRHDIQDDLRPVSVLLSVKSQVPVTP